jgi:hypothetical protein
MALFPESERRLDDEGGLGGVGFILTQSAEAAAPDRETLA